MEALKTQLVPAWATWSDPELPCFEEGLDRDLLRSPPGWFCDAVARTGCPVHPSLSTHSVSPIFDTTDFLHLCKAISLQDTWSRSRILGLTTPAASSHLHNPWLTRSYVLSILSASMNETPAFVDSQPFPITKRNHWLDVLTYAAILLFMQLLVVC